MKAAVYLRTSTLEQSPEKQEADCRAFCVEKGYVVEGVYLEKLSGFKDIKRPQYELVKEKAQAGEIKAVVVWAFDRWVRNRDTLLDDVTILRGYGCKLHSVKDAWLEAVNIEGPLGKTIQDFLLGMIGSIAEMDSSRRSERMKLAYKARTGRWGRKGLPLSVFKKVGDLHAQGLSVREIARQVWYFSKSNNKKYLSVGAVHKIITSNKDDLSLKEDRKEGVQ